MFSLFGYYTTSNVGFEGVGRANRGSQTSERYEWVPVDIYSLFPGVVGEANRRFDFFSYRADRERKGRAYQALVERLKVLHNRKDPDRPIDRLQIYVVEWPKSHHGYWAEFARRKRTLLIDQ